MRKEIKISKALMQKYLQAKESSKVSIIEYERLGSGWHGTGYKVKYQITNHKSQKKVKEVVIRTLMPADFSHDYKSDRAKVFILQHEMAQEIPGHVVSFDVSGYTKKGELTSLGDIEEFFQIVEVAQGETYSSDFQRIKTSGTITDADRKKALAVSDYLVKLHSKTLKADAHSTRSIRRRHTRDAVGHGEMMMGVIDTYPDDFTFISKEKLTDLICKTVKSRERTKDTPFIPCHVHGDFHPGNIIFKGNKLTVLDASRQLWGDPADDVAAMAINYIWFAVMQSGGFSGPFAELFEIFWNNYFKKTNDMTIPVTAGVHFAFRGVVVAHPIFYKDQSDEVRRKMIKFVDNVLNEGPFDPHMIKEYLG